MDTMKRVLLQKIADKTLRVGVIGLGYVGLPLAVEKAKAGFQTIGFDVQEDKVDCVNRGQNYIGDVVDDDLAALVKAGTLRATSDFRFVRDVDFIAICVPTPLDRHQQPDISYVEASVRSVAKHMTAGTVVVLESSTYPGTTEDLIKPILETGTNLVCGRDFYLGFSPERVDPGNLIYKTKNTPKVVGAIGEDAKEVITAVYRAVLDGEVYATSSPAVAEMEKILENMYRNVNIGLVNELAQLCHKMGIDVWEVIDAASTKPFGFQPFYPGPGLGGHCIPLDPYYLSWKAREYGFHTSMIEASMMINDAMPDYVCTRVAELLNRDGKAVKEATILMLGLAYKRDLNDVRESPALSIRKTLRAQGAHVPFYDPYFTHYTYEGQEETGGLSTLTDEALQTADLVLITTDHSQVDYDRVARLARRIFDTRNATKSVSDKRHIERL